MLRHGLAEYNERGIINSHPDNALLQNGLTKQGAAQVLKSAALFDKMYENPLVVSSDYRRAAESAAVFASYFDSPITLDSRLRERWFGDLDGESTDRYNEVWDAMELDVMATPFAIESVQSVRARVHDLIAELEAREQGRAVVLVSHGDVIAAMVHEKQGGSFKAVVQTIGNAALIQI